MARHAARTLPSSQASASARKPEPVQGIIDGQGGASFPLDWQVKREDASPCLRVWDVARCRGGGRTAWKPAAAFATDGSTVVRRPEGKLRSLVQDGLFPRPPVILVRRLRPPAGAARIDRHTRCRSDHTLRGCGPSAHLAFGAGAQESRLGRDEGRVLLPHGV